MCQVLDSRLSLMANVLFMFIILKSDSLNAHTALLTAHLI